MSIKEKGSKIVTEQGIFYMIQSGCETMDGLLDSDEISYKDKLVESGDYAARPKRVFLDEKFNKYIGYIFAQKTKEEVEKLEANGIETFVGKGTPFVETPAFDHWRVSINKDMDNEQGVWAVPTKEDLKHYEELGIKKPAKKYNMSA